MPSYVKRVLIVEDNLDMCRFLQDILRHLHIEMQTAQTGAAAIAAMEWFEPDVMVLDLGLPDMDGWQLIRELRAREKLPVNVRLIAVTGWHAAKASKEAADEGFYAYFSKPLDPTDFIHTLVVKDSSDPVT